MADPGWQPDLRRGGSPLVGVLILAWVARLAVVIAWPENLTDDRDGYLALAEGLAAGRGFSVPGTETPTAYRPPLYPLLLIPSAILPSGVWTALLHVACGLLTVWLTWVLAERVTGKTEGSAEFFPALAAGLVAVDPILLRYTTLPMTEVLATCLVTALLVVVAGRSDAGGPQASRSIGAGLLFGLAALCRPTVWAFAALMGVSMIIRSLSRRRTEDDTFRLRDSLIAISAAAVVVLPWAVRNKSTFGRPILMTTHGGYTLLLGNNPAFGREVVDQPWGTVWDGSHGGGQQGWVDDLHRQMESAGVTGEVEQDRWLRNRAVDNIQNDPSMFLRATLLRLRRFWGLMPVETAQTQPDIFRWGVGAFYLLVFAGAAIGLVTVIRRWSPVWDPPLLMVLCFAGVHLVYWTNTRMRAPVVPVIALLAAFGWSRCIMRVVRSAHGRTSQL